MSLLTAPCSPSPKFCHRFLPRSVKAGICGPCSSTGLQVGTWGERKDWACIMGRAPVLRPPARSGPQLCHAEPCDPGHNSIPSTPSSCQCPWYPVSAHSRPALPTVPAACLSSQRRKSKSQEGTAKFPILSMLARIQHQVCQAGQKSSARSP